MKTNAWQLLLGPLCLASGMAWAQSCWMEDAQEFQLGVHKGVKGTCSNGGREVSCTYHDDGHKECLGPEGTYSGDVVGALVASACGCGS